MIKEKLKYSKKYIIKTTQVLCLSSYYYKIFFKIGRISKWVEKYKVRTTEYFT